MIARFILLPVIVLSTMCPVNAQDITEAELPADTVRIGAYIISVHDINFQDKEYTLRFWLWTLFKNPALDFATQIDIPNAKSIDEPQVIIDVIEGTTWQLMKMKCTMKQAWKVQNYPFDKQHLVVHIENNIFDKNRLVFVPDELGSTYDREMTIDGWHISHFEVNVSDTEYITVFGDPTSDLLHSEYSSFNIVMDIERKGWGLFWKLFSGMYIAFLISMVCFFLKPEELEPRFGLPVGGLFAAVGNKYIIDSLLPESNTFTLVDSLHSITFLTIFIILTISAIVLKVHNRGNDTLALRINYVAAWAVALVFVILNLALVIKVI